MIKLSAEMLLCMYPPQKLLFCFFVWQTTLVGINWPVGLACLANTRH